MGMQMPLQDYLEKKKERLAKLLPDNQWENSRLEIQLPESSSNFESRRQHRIIQRSIESRNSQPETRNAM